MFFAPLSAASIIAAALSERHAQSLARRPLIEIDRTWQINTGAIFGCQVLRPGPDPLFPRCAYCGLRGSGVRCDGCGAPK